MLVRTIGLMLERALDAPMEPEEITLRLRLLDDRCRNSMRMAMSYYEEIMDEVLNSPKLAYTHNWELERLNMLRKELDVSIVAWATDNNNRLLSGELIPDKIRLERKEQDFKSLNRVAVSMAHIRAAMSAVLPVKKSSLPVKKYALSDLVTAAMPTNPVHWLTVNKYMTGVLHTKD
jgi:hypothetical protein